MNILDLNNYFFNPYAIPHFGISLCILVLMCFFYRAEGNTFVSFSLLVMSSSFLLWMFNDGMMYSSVHKDVALWWAKIGYIGVTLLPASCLQFTFAVLGIYKKHRTTVRWLWAVSSLFYLLSQVSNHFISGIQSFWWGHYSSFGWIGLLFIVFNMTVFAYCTWHFIIEYRKAAPTSLQRTRAKACMVAFGIGYLGSLDYVATFGIALYPFGYAPILILLLILARTALRYRLNVTPSFAAQNIIDTMSDALVILAEDGTVALTNPVARQLFNTSNEKLLGTNFQQLTNWDILPKNREQLAALCPITNSPVTLQSPYSQNTIYLELSISTMRESNKIMVFVCLLRDVTLKTIAEQELRKAHEELEQRVKNRTRELEVANHGLQQEAAERILIEREKAELIIKSLTQSKLASLGEVATGIAHEINQPLSFIRIIFESTLKDLNNNRLDDKELVADCHESLKQVTRITTIINHLRTFGRGDDTELHDHVDLREVLDNTMILMRQRLKLRNINFTVAIAEKIPQLRANPVRLEQVFINLIQNSVDAIEGISAPKISIDIYQHNKLVQIVFSDNGSGIPSTIRDKIFEPFFTSKEVGRGTGLGLSIIYGIIKEHHGAIELDCANGETSFIITLPIM